MNFHFTEEEQDILDMLKDFCVKEVAPKAAEVDENERFPEETWHALGEMGMMGVPFPEEYGGADMSYLRNWRSIAPPLPLWCPPTPACAAGPSTSSAPRNRSRSTCPSCAPASGWGPLA